MVAMPGGSDAMRYAMVAVVGLLILRFFWRVRYHLKRWRGLSYRPA